ncbi:unnamed protein product [Phytophthora fragariaefolia]|uniref:Unnamed protein product n=1 Tax=Phytophthora fragariaefolia TaxID=1490495 RepID=A0A9W7D709_9STRA|nr:unnamed protein product [Phytophthora fragariaefolia]
MQPAYTGKRVSNLSLNELEYTNGNELNPSQLVDLVRQWGGTDILVVSHANYMEKKQRWPAISCLRHAARIDPDIAYSFRLYLPSPTEASTVYGNYLETTKQRVFRHGHPTDTSTFKMVANVEWNSRLGVLYRPSEEDKQERSERRALVFGLTSEITGRALEQELESHGLTTTSIEIRKKNSLYAVVEFVSKKITLKAVETFGPDGVNQLRLGNIKLAIKQMDPNPPERTCFKCRKPGHFGAQCPELTVNNVNNYQPSGSARAILRQDTQAMTFRGDSKSKENRVTVRMVEHMVGRIIDNKLEDIRHEMIRVIPPTP